MPTDLSKRYAYNWENFSKGIDQQGPYYNMDYRFDNWADSDNVANELMGWSSRTGDLTVRKPPHACVLSTNLSCVDCKIEGVGNAILNSSGIPFYDNGFIAHVTYRALAYMPQGFPDPGNDIGQPIPWAVQEVDYDTQHFDVPWNTYKYASDSLKTSIPYSIEVGITIYNITFFKLPYLPIDAIRKCRGRVNDGVFLGFPDSTVLFKGAKTTREFNTDGTIVNRATLVFHERDVSWNMVPRPNELCPSIGYGNWDTLTDASSGSLFQKADMSGLIVL